MARPSWMASTVDVKSSTTENIHHVVVVENVDDAIAKTKMAANWKGETH